MIADSQGSGGSLRVPAGWPLPTPANTPHGDTGTRNLRSRRLWVGQAGRTIDELRP